MLKNGQPVDDNIEVNISGTNITITREDVRNVLEDRRQDASDQRVDLAIHDIRRQLPELAAQHPVKPHPNGNPPEVNAKLDLESALYRSGYTDICDKCGQPRNRCPGHQRRYYL